MTSSRILSQNDVHQFLAARKTAATQIATGVLLCILAAAPMLVLIGFTTLGLFKLPLEMMTILGVIILLIIITIGVAFFIAADRQTKIHEELEYENCQLTDELTTEVQQQKEQYAKKYTAMTITGTVLCILSAIPLLCSVFFIQILNDDQTDNLMTVLVAGTLILIAVGVFFFVKSSIIMDSYNILLQTDDYTPRKKVGRKVMNRYATLYWLTITLLYLGYSFTTNNWERSWIIWPIAGILYGIIEKIISLHKNNISTE